MSDYYDIDSMYAEKESIEAEIASLKAQIDNKYAILETLDRRASWSRDLATNLKTEIAGLKSTRKEYYDALKDLKDTIAEAKEYRRQNKEYEREERQSSQYNKFSSSNWRVPRDNDYGS